MIDWASQAENQIAIIEDEKNQKAIKRYKRWMHDKDFSDKSISEKLRILTKMSNAIGKPFEEITDEDMEDYIYSDEFTRHSKTKKELSKSSVDRYKIDIRTFFKWVNANFGKDKKKMKSNVYPDVVDWFEFSKNNNNKLPEDLLTKQEILDMIENAGNLRDQTLISLLYDSMGRLNEVLSLNEDDVHADKYGFYIVIKDKTSKTYGRRVRLHVSVPYLKLYLNSQTKDKPLFESKMDNRLSPSHTRYILKNCAKRAKIQKRVYPHLIRHSKATELAGTLTEQQLKVIGGWKPDSRMTGVYVHLSGADTDRAQLEMYNLIPEDDEPEINPLEPKECPRCHNLNPASNSAFCVVCGYSMNDEIPHDTEVDVLKTETDVLKQRINEMENKESEMLQTMKEMFEAKMKEMVQNVNTGNQDRVYKEEDLGDIVYTPEEMRMNKIAKMLDEEEEN